MNQTATRKWTRRASPAPLLPLGTLLLLCLAFFFHQGDRAIFGVVISEIRADLKLTDSQLGLVGSVLFLTMALMMPLAGIVGDRLKKNRIITISLIFWSSATLFTGCVQGLFGLLLLRSVATAGGEAFYSPAAYPLMARFHQRTRALALSLHQAALYVGVMTSGFLVGWIAENWGWRSAFYASAAAEFSSGWSSSSDSRTPEQPAAAGQPNAAGLLESMGIIFRVPTAADHRRPHGDRLREQRLVVWAGGVPAGEAEPLARPGRRLFDVLASPAGAGRDQYRRAAFGPLGEETPLFAPRTPDRRDGPRRPLDRAHGIGAEPADRLRWAGGVRLLPRTLRIEYARGDVPSGRAALPSVGRGDRRHGGLPRRLDFPLDLGQVPRAVRSRPRPF